MGEVYKACDTTLNREVALKILPEAFALDAERIARFKREAQVLASLTYPNFSPDGRQVAFDIRDQDNDIWIWDLRRRNTLRRLTFDPGFDQYA
ncbi:MAG TPA: hypothetical protein VKE51_25270, partial [Vicinamibacterales bacterium]|nr:hypothetical protein [Vicinamibacterales bacterium]